jgi:endonuclease/exonuclease/phosphatase family metal-dependent hydrolase
MMISSASDVNRYLAKLITEEAPDIILLQEVRLDNRFTAAWNGIRRDSPYDYGSQVDHILEYLLQEHQLIRDSNTTDTADLLARGYHVVYQPAMFLFNANDRNANIQERVEEGVMILSRYPILDPMALLLSRDMKDSRSELTTTLDDTVISSTRLIVVEMIINACSYLATSVSKDPSSYKFSTLISGRIEQSES